MAKIGLTEGFTLIPEGTHVFKITNVNYKEEFGKMEVTLQTNGGSKHIERFSLLKTDGSPNEGALNAFSYFARVAMNDSGLTEIDHTDLIGCFIECDVTHDIVPNKNKPGQTLTFVRLADKRPSEGWDEVTATITTSSSKKTATITPNSGKKAAVDLATLLG